MPSVLEIIFSVAFSKTSKNLVLRNLFGLIGFLNLLDPRGVKHLVHRSNILPLISSSYHFHIVFEICLSRDEAKPMRPNLPATDARMILPEDEFLDNPYPREPWSKQNLHKLDLKIISLPILLVKLVASNTSHSQIAVVGGRA
jgi:hypothetical protein